MSDNHFIRNKGFNVTLQTGEQQNDKYFLYGDIILTTIDQSLSSLLSIPLALPLRQANINAGAVVSSYLVFDEFHLLQPDLSLSTLFHLLKQLKGITPFCLMTATLSQKLLKAFANELNTEIVSPDEQEVRQIRSQSQKMRIVEPKSSYLTADAVLSNHQKGSRSIVICNTVLRCQKVYQDIKNDAPKTTAILCIHSRFFGNDRRIKEEMIKKLFGRGSKADAIMVATQVIEVGIDISCDVMHTEISPINSLLQRIGRCARFENEKGNVFIYQVSTCKPYKEDVTKLTFEELQRINGQNLDYYQGQKIIDAVLTENELAELQRMQASNRKEEIRTVWMQPEKARASELIREIDSLNVLLNNNPNSILNPYAYETVSINKWALLSNLKKIEIEEDDWLIRAVRESNIIGDDIDNENLLPERFAYERISIDDVRLENFIIVNSDLISYSNTIGLNFLNEGDGKSQITEITTKKEKIKITKDTYEEHIGYMIEAYDRYFRGRVDYILELLLKQLEIKLPVNDLINFIIVMHDFGKLNKRWQQIATEHQQTKRNFKEGEILAHTDFDADKDINIKFPPHAGAGAIAAWSILENALIEEATNPDKVIRIVKAVATSILRHHSADAVKSKDYSIIRQGPGVIKDLLNLYAPRFANFDAENAVLISWEQEDLSHHIVAFDDVVESLFYFLLVRILRICDQKSFEIKSALQE